MSVKYLQFSISINGLDPKDDVIVGFLKGYIKEAVRGSLAGNMKELSGFRDEFGNDIEVELVEQAGKFEVINIGSTCICPYCDGTIDDEEPHVLTQSGDRYHHSVCI